MLFKKIINYSLLISLLPTNFTFVSCKSSLWGVVIPNLDEEAYYFNNGELPEQCYFYIDNKSVAPDEWLISSYYLDANDQKIVSNNFSITTYGKISWLDLEQAVYNVTVIAIFNNIYYSNSLRINIHNDFHLEGEKFTFHDADLQQSEHVIGAKWSLFDKEGNEVIDEDNPVVYDINLGWWSGIQINIDTGTIHFNPSILEGSYPYYVTAIYRNKKYVSSTNNIYVYRSSNFIFQDIDSTTCSITTNPNNPIKSFNKELYLPPIYNDKTVVEIADDFLLDCVSFNSPILFHNNIKKIGNNFMKNCSSFNQLIELPKSINYIGNNFMADCSSFNNASQEFEMPDLITKINDDFLCECSAFNVPIHLPMNLESIGKHFLEYCTTYNSIITLPKTLKYIDSYFLHHSSSFNQELELPSSLIQVESFCFMFDCFSFVNKIFVNCDIESFVIRNWQKQYTCSTFNSAALSYVQGMQVTGLYGTAFKNKFPNIKGSVVDDKCYRNLL